MALTDVQEQAVRRWAGEGCGLSDIQKRLAGEFQLPMTYMDVRFLVIELGLKLQDRVVRPAKEASTLGAAKAGGVRHEEEAGLEDEPAAGLGGGGNVSVQLDRVMKAGALASGSVVFSDGVSASWALDQFGRLALNAARPGYRPPEADIQAFQMELRSVLEKRGL